MAALAAAVPEQQEAMRLPLQGLEAMVRPAALPAAALPTQEAAAVLPLALPEALAALAAVAKAKDLKALQ
jgi:hypothetical protein